MAERHTDPPLSPTDYRKGPVVYPTLSKSLFKPLLIKDVNNLSRKEVLNKPFYYCGDYVPEYDAYQLMQTGPSEEDPTVCALLVPCKYKNGLRYLNLTRAVRREFTRLEVNIQHWTFPPPRLYPPPPELTTNMQNPIHDYQRVIKSTLLQENKKLSEVLFFADELANRRTYSKAGVVLLQYYDGLFRSLVRVQKVPMFSLFHYVHPKDHHRYSEKACILLDYYQGIFRSLLHLDKVQQKFFEEVKKEFYPDSLAKDAPTFDAMKPVPDMKTRAVKWRSDALDTWMQFELHLPKFAEEPKRVIFRGDPLLADWNQWAKETKNPFWGKDYPSTPDHNCNRQIQPVDEIRTSDFVQNLYKPAHSTLRKLAETVTQFGKEEAKVTSKKKLPVTDPNDASTASTGATARPYPVGTAANKMSPPAPSLAGTSFPKKAATVKPPTTPIETATPASSTSTTSTPKEELAGSTGVVPPPSSISTSAGAVPYASTAAPLSKQSHPFTPAPLSKQQSTALALPDNNEYYEMEYYEMPNIVPYPSSSGAMPPPPPPSGPGPIKLPELPLVDIQPSTTSSIADTAVPSPPPPPPTPTTTTQEQGQVQQSPPAVTDSHPPVPKETLPVDVTVATSSTEAPAQSTAAPSVPPSPSPPPPAVPPTDEMEVDGVGASAAPVPESRVESSALPPPPPPPPPPAESQSRSDTQTDGVNGGSEGATKSVQDGTAVPPTPAAASTSEVVPVSEPKEKNQEKEKDMEDETGVEKEKAMEADKDKESSDDDDDDDDDDVEMAHVDSSDDIMMDMDDQPPAKSLEELREAELNIICKELSEFITKVKSSRNASTPEYQYHIAIATRFAEKARNSMDPQVMLDMMGDSLCRMQSLIERDRREEEGEGEDRPRKKVRVSVR